MGGDSGLVQDAVQNKEGAMDALIGHFYKDALYFAISKIGAQEAEEVTQQAMLAVIQNIKKLKDPAAFKAWMFKIVNNEIHMFRRKSKRVTLTEVDDTIIEESRDDRDNDNFLPEEYVLEEEKRTQVIKAVRDLPENYADCILLYYYEGMSYTEIAQALEINEDKVRNSLYRGKNLLKQRLEKQAGKSFVLASAFIPATELTSIFQTDAQTHVSADAVTRCLDFVHSQQSIGAVSQGAAAATQSGGKIAAAVALSVSVVALTAGIAFAVIGGEPDQPVAPVNEATETIIIKEAEIITVADMIGAEQAALLDSFVQNGTNAEAWAAFLEGIGANPEDSAIQENNLYQLYSLNKQDKQLLLMQKGTVGSNDFEVRYRFGKTEKIPSMIKLVMEFDI